ncbi:FAST kinase domain-containing protein 4-like [Myxocyprinus asiaticus]|uniref:FAST kinase domain-containing protein 4-like n=1 Tax=Myxocyprinus asiaticus TaxID=70543 RepID=UPI002222DC0A|nr:FAST kinase domain-containing protein 4-like [Myxocyprinus asiaticus]XP_051577605.1 FAST kinase domain-containing protein 4-like [Myxocyprinus asiaticus]XP_051577607.1 FAST kinase domain-containing protein 4-like [Myxocyprinus asiaticus]
MTTRLLCRWARHFPHCPQAAAASARLQMPTVHSTGPACSLTISWIQSASRHLCQSSELAKVEESPIPYERSEIVGLVEKAATPQEVLQLWAEQGGSAGDAARCLIQLSLRVMEKGGDGILQDPCCENMLETVNSQVSSVWNGSLVALLRALTMLGLPSDAPLLHSLQNEVLWRIRRLTYRHLAYLVDWVAFQRSKGQENEALTKTLLKQLELRWTELCDPRTITILMSRASLLSPSLMDKLEDKALELSENFSAEDISRVAFALAAQNRRAVPLLRALSYHLNQKPSLELKTPLLLDVAYAYGKLNFHQTQVLQRIAAELLPRLSELSSLDVTRCAKSLAFLKWLHLPLFEGFAQHYLSNSEKYSTLQVCNLLMSFAKLNFHLSKRAEFFPKVHTALESAFQNLEPFLKTDVVWSLCVLNQAKPDYITSVTKPAFQKKLSAGGSAGRTENYRQKLLHISAYAQLEPLGATVAASPIVLLPVLQSKVESNTPLQSGLHTALQNLTNSRTQALRTAVKTVYGWTIDGELVVDSENRSIDLENIKAPHLPGGGGTDALPAGTRRIAFVALEFPNFCLRSKDLLGRFVMQKRHLQLAGFIVVEVPYFEWLELKSDWQKVAYLKDKLGKAVAEDMAK